MPFRPVRTLQPDKVAEQVSSITENTLHDEFAVVVWHYAT
jgi:hypothetical protein